MALGNPIYTVEWIEKTLLHAVQSAQTARVPMRVLIVAPAWRDWTAREGVYRVMQLRARAFKFLAPQSALGYTDRSTGARFNVDILFVQNELAARRFSVPPLVLGRIARHFKGRMTIMPTYDPTWVVQTVEDAELRASKDAFPARLRALGTQLRGQAALRLEQRRLISRWCERESVPAGPRWQGTLAVDAVHYARTIDRECAGTARVFLDRNAGVGGIICQRRYFEMLVQERETSAARFVPAEDGVTEVMLELAKKYKSRELHTIAKFDTNGIYGNVYALPKDKDKQLQKFRPIQPNNRAPMAKLQNVLGRAMEFLVLEIGDSFTCGGTQLTVEHIRTFNEGSRGAKQVLGFTFDVKDQFSNVEHQVAKVAIEKTIEEGFALRQAAEALLVRRRGARGVRWWQRGLQGATYTRVGPKKMLDGMLLSLTNNFVFIAGVLVRQTRGVGMGGSDSPSTALCVCAYGEREFTRSRQCDERYIKFIRQADDCLALVRCFSGSRREWRRLRAELRRYRDSCYLQGMRVLQTGSAGDDASQQSALEWCGMQVTFRQNRVSVRQLLQNEKRGSLTADDATLAFPFVSWHSACTEQTKAVTAISSLYRIAAHCSDEACITTTLNQLHTEFRRQSYPDGWLSRAVRWMAHKYPIEFWGRLWSGMKTAGIDSL